MSVCNLEQQVELKKSLEQYSNVLLLKEVGNKSFDYLGITKKIYDAVFSKNKDQPQSLGIVYHVPQILLNLIDVNPQISVSDINGVKLEELKKLIGRVNQNDGLDYLGKKIGVISTPLAAIEAEIANESKNLNVPIITTSSIQDLSVDELVFPEFTLKSTGQQLLKDIITDLPSINQTNPNENFYYEKVLLNLLNSGGDVVNYTDVEYSNHKGFRLLAIRTDQIPNQSKNIYTNFTGDRVVLAVVDNKGNFLHFNENGDIVPEEEGKIAYFVMEVKNEDDLENMRKRMLQPLEASIIKKVNSNESIPDSDKEFVITEEVNKAKEYIAKEVKKKQDEALNIIINAKANKPVLLDITGGSKGGYANTDSMQPDRKRAAEKPLSEFNLTDKEKRSIQFITEKKGGSVQVLPSIYFDKYDKLISLKNPKTLSTDAEVLENIIDILTEDPKYFGKFLTATAKKTYINQFIRFDAIKGVVLTKEGLFIDGKKIEDKQEAKNLLREKLGKTYLSFMQEPYANNQYDWFTITNNGEIQVDKKNYFDFISKRFVPRVAMDITENRKGLPMIVNSYFTFKQADEEVVIATRAKEAVESVKKDETLDLPTIDPNEVVFRSKLLDTIPTTPAQEKRAEEFLNTNPVFDAVDENGVKLLDKDFTRTLVNSDAFASFTKSAVTLYQGASFTHGYHEAWHVFSQLYLTKPVRDNLYKAVSKLKGSFEVVKKTGGPGGNNYEKVTVNFSDLDPTKQEDRLLLEEFIAEEFRIFAINKGKFKTKSAKTTVLQKIFNRIWELLKNLFSKSGTQNIYSNPGSKTVLDEMFDVLYKGKDLGMYMPSIENAEFGTLNSGIINEEGEEIFTYQEAIDLTNSIDGIISLATDSLIAEGNKINQVRNGFVLKAITNPVNQKHIYNVVVKDAFTKKLNEYVAYVKNNAGKVSDDVLNNYKKTITTLRKALVEENYGSINDIQEGKASNNSLIAFHQENSAYKDLFAIADYEQDIDESDSESIGKTKRADNKSGNQIKSEEEATKETLFLVKSLLKRENDGRLKYNNLGFPEPVDFISTWRVLIDKLGGATTINGLYNNMLKADKMNIAPYFKQLLLKAGNPTVTMPASKEASQLWISLYQSFCLYKMPLMITQYEEEYNDETGGTDVKIRVGRATADYYKVKKRDWPSKFAQNTSKFVKTDAKRVNTINLKAVKKEFIKTGYDKDGKPVFGVDRADWIPFLNSIGLYLSNNSDIKYQLREQDIMYLTQAIGLAEMTNMDIDNPIEFFSKVQKFTVKNNKNVDINITLSASVGRIDYLASLEAQHSIEYATQMVKGASGNLKNTNSLNSTYTKIVNSLNEVTHRGQMYDSSLTGDYQHMYYLNPEFNPQAAANIAVNSLFNLDGTKDENNDITVFDTDGANYRDLNGEVTGVPYSKMDPLDKVITDITSMLFYGVQEATSRAAEKKSYHGIKVKNLKTYTGKKAKYLYLDIEAFLRNEEGLRLIDMDTNQIILNLMYPKLEAELKRIKMIRDDADYYKNYQGFEKAAQFSSFDDVLEQTAKKGESLKDRLTTDAFLQEVADKGIRTVLIENTAFRDELDMQILTYFKNLKERYEKHYIKSTGLKTDDNQAKLPEVLISNLKDRFYANGLVNKSNIESLGEGQEEAIKNAVFGAYTINAWLYHDDMGGLIHTDFFQFNHAKNEGTKRISPYQSPGNIFATDNNAKVHIDTYVKRPYEQKLIDDKVIGNKNIRSFDAKFNTAIIKESVVRSVYYEMYEEMFKNAMKRRGITSEKQINIELYGKGGLDKNGNPTGGRMKPYSEIKDADGQGFISFDAYRILKNLESDWSPSQEAAYQRIINGENLEPEKLQDLFPVYKLGYAGALAITGKYPINSIHKYSLFPLIPNVIKNSVLDEVHKKMISQDTDYIVFESGSKQSYVKASPTSRGDEIFETSADGTSDTSRLKPNFTFTKNPIFIAYLKNQTKINSYFKGQATLASQLRKLFNVGLYNQGKPINKKAEQKTKRVYDLIDRLTQAKKTEILRKIKWKEIPDPNRPGKTKLVGNMEDMIAFVKKKLKQQGFTQEQIDYIDTDSNGYVDLSTHPNAPQIEKLLISIINNDIVRLKINGEPLVEVSGALNQDIKFKKPTKADLETYGTNGLKGYVVDPNGEKNTKGFGVKIALTENYQKLFYTKYLTKDEKGKYKDSGETIAVYKKDKEGNRILDFDASFNRLNEMIKLNEWLNIDNNRLKIRITGVRIPVQGPNSAEFAEVWEFLQPSAGPIIIIPAEIVAKSGTDFDVDKLTTYLKYISSRGTLFEDKYETVEELEEHIKKLEENFDKALLKDVKKQIGDTIKEKDLKWISIKDNLKDFRKAIIDATANKFIGKENYNSLTTKDNKKLLENLQNKKLVEFVKKNLKEAYKIYDKGIKDFDRAKYDKISESIENLYKQKSALAQQALEISLAKEQKRNFTKVIENDLIDAIVDVLSMPEMAEALLSPNDTHLTKYITETDEEGTGEEGLKSLVQRLDNKTDYEKSINTGERNQPKGISPTRMLEWDYNTDKQQDNISGGQGLGIVAVAGTNSNLFRMIGAAMNAKMPVAISYLNPKTNKRSEKIVDVDLDMKLNYNQTKDGAISLSHARDTNDMNSVAEIISQLLNGFVDIGKDEWVTYLQGNPTVIPKILFLIDAGVPFEEIAYFMTNPMIREYVRLEKNYAASLSKVIYGIDHDPTQAKKLAKTKMKASFNIPEDTTRPNERNVYKLNSDNIYGLKLALDFYKKGDKFSLKELKEVAKSPLNIGDHKQKAGFAQYLIIEEMIKDYDQVKMVINPDTNTSPNLLEAKIKISKIKGMKNAPTLDPKMIPNLLNTGALKPFLVQDFALDLFSPLFPTRNHPKLIDFLINTVESRKEMEAIDKKTGQDEVKFSIKYQNSLYQYIFTNTLKKYRLGQEEYNQMPVDSLINMDEVVKEFNDKEYINSDIYLGKGLYPVNAKAFANASLDEFIEFSLEREYLRKTMPFEVVSETEEFKNRYNILKGLSRFVNFNKTELSKVTYESWLVQTALKNNYNIYKLFKSGKETVAQELMSIIQNNQPLVRDYSILGQFKAEAVPNTKDKKFKDYLNFTLVDINDMDEKKKTEYKRQLKDLANPSVIKIKDNPQANAYISNFFRQLPMYSFLQSGMNSSNFNLMDIMPDTDYKRVMDEASVNLKNLLDSPRGIDFLKGFKELYKQLYNTKNNLILNRGLDWRKSAADVIALREAIDQDVDNLKYAIEYSDNVYMLDESMLEFKDAVKENEKEIIDDFGYQRLRKTDGKKALIEKIKNANTDALVIGSLKDLVSTFKGLTSDNLADLKTSIDKAIKYASELAVSGKKVIFLSSMFDITPEAINQLKTTQPEKTEPSKVKVISPDYGVVQVETNPTEEKTEEFVNLIRPQIQAQTYKENIGKFANEMFHYGLMWARNNPKAKPVKINKFEGANNNYYNYHTLDQKGNPLPSIKVLQPIIDEIQKSLGIDMSDYDSVIGNIYLDNQYVYPHKDTTESVTARNYPVIVYTIGNDSGLGIVDDNDGKMTFTNKYNTVYLPSGDKLKGYTNEVLTKNGTIYTFGMDGKGRFELTHSTPTNSEKTKPYPPITLPNGNVVTNYTITLTFRRAADLEPGMPKTPAKLGSQLEAPTTISTEVKGNIQLELIEDLVQQGVAKTTVRNYDRASGVYKSSKTNNLYNLVNRGKVRMVADKIVGKGISYTLDEFGAAEGFDNWEGFTKAAKFAGKDLMAGKEVFLYDISPAGKTADKARPVFDSLPGKSATPTMTYAGIGSRETPQEVLDVMTQAAKYLDDLGYTLNTGKTYPTSLNDYFIKTVHKGNRQVAEEAFKAKQAETERLTKLYGNKVGMDEEGADRAFSAGASKKNLFSPMDKIGDREMKVGEEIHPNWSALSTGAAKLMARNTNQVFGANLDTPVDFVLFYAQEVPGSIRPKGGTGQAVEMARRKGIPTINMADTNWRDQLKEAIKKKPVAPTTEAPASTQRTFKDEELHQAYIKGGLEAVTKLIKENKKKELNEAKLLSKEVEMLQEFESLNSKSNKTNSENDRVIELYTILKNSKQLDFEYSLNQLNLSTKPQAPVTESTPEGLPNDTYMYYGTSHKIVRDASGKGIDVVGYKGKTSRKLALLEKYNENPDVDPQTDEYFRNKPEEETKTTRSEKLEGDSILDARTQMIDYTSKQRKALLEIESLIDSGKQAYYLLAGYAGTGKTTIAENIARYGKDAGKDVMIIAPTNKAAKVLRDKLKKANVRGIEAQTIHKTIYGAPDELTGEWVKGKPVKNSVIIIDESSMISKDVMQDLLETTDTNNVVVFMGDGFQLEPVGEDSGLFAGKVKEVKAKTELTEVKRQSLDSSILKVATLVRTDDKAYVPQESYEDFKVVRDRMEFINDYKKAIRENEDAVMIVATNAERILMNNIARKEKYKDDIAILNDDDVLMSVANSDAYPNSETFKVKSIIDSSDIMEFTLTTRDGKSSTYDVTFVDVITEDGKDAKIMLIPELDKPSLYHGQVLENAKGEVLKYLQRNELIKATKRGRKLSPTLVIGTYGYAVTAHKSQGSQWSKVFVNQNYVAPTWNAARWYYTAITRAADNVEVFVTNNNTKISNEKIEEKINQIAQEDVTSQKSVKLKDGKTYTAAQVNSKMLESMGYTPAEIGKILKELC